MGDIRQVSGKGYKGAFERLLSQHPIIRHLVMDAFLRSKYSVKTRFTRPVMVDIHRSFLNALRREGGSDDVYPFCTKDEGFRALRKFLRDCHEQMSNQKIYIVPRARPERLLHEVESAVSMSKPGTTQRNPFQIVELDAHQVGDNLSVASLRRAFDLARAGRRVEDYRASKKKSSNIRLSRADKEALARRIKDSAQTMVRGQGILEAISGGQVLSLDTQTISIVHTTPFSGFPGAPANYGIDIWYAGRKVFSVWWEPFQVVTFHYGEWMNMFVPGSYQSPGPDA